MSANDLADRPPNVIAELLHHRATQNAIVRSYGIMPSSRTEDDDLDRAAAVLLREQAEQLDTLRRNLGDGVVESLAGGGVPEEGATDEQ